MITMRNRFAAALVLLALLGLAACSREGQDQMSWARAALDRNDRVEVVAADPDRGTFTVRVKDTGELRIVRADELTAGPAMGIPGSQPTKVAPAAAAPSAGAAASESAQLARPGEEAAVPDSDSRAAVNASAAPPARASAAAVEAETPGGQVLEAGPGYSIKAATGAPTAVARARDSAVTSAAVERRHEPIVCQGSRLLHIDNRNLEFEGDAVSAQAGCEIYITNSHITATGVGVSARAANVHIDNSLIEGDTASIDASDGAQVYASSSHFRGLSRQLDSASFHDLGGNVWN
jgi:hypothetical protein